MMPQVLAFFDLPDDNVLREKVRDVLARPDYRLDPPGDSAAWFIEMLLNVLAWIIWPFKWIYNFSEGLPEFLRWLVVLAMIAVMGLVVGHIVYTVVSAIRGSDREKFALPSESTPQRMTAAELETLAEQAANRGELVVAVRYLFRASLARLELREKKMTRRGLTNREHLRRYRGTPFFDPLEVLVSTIEWKWYGEQPCADEDWESCRRAYQSVARLLSRASKSDVADVGSSQRQPVNHQSSQRSEGVSTAAIPTMGGANVDAS